MLSDPIVSAAYVPTVPTFAVGPVANFRKIQAGKAISVDGPFSADQPAFLSVRQRTRKYGTVKLTPSDFTVRYEQHFNVSPVNGVPQDDIPLVVEIRILSYPQFHTVANLVQGLNAAALTVYSNTARLQSGEGI